MKKRDVSRHEQRHDRLLREHVHDPYKTRLKLSDPAVCTDCGAVYVGDRWTWSEVPEGADQVLCAACHRIRDHATAGEVRLSGAFLPKHKTEILHLAHNVEAEEKGEHPLHRIMAVSDSPDGVLITTTDIHLPRRIGQAIYDAYRGELDFHYEEEAYFIRVAWSRNE